MTLRVVTCGIRDEARFSEIKGPEEVEEFTNFLAAPEHFQPELVPALQIKRQPNQEIDIILDERRTSPTSRFLPPCLFFDVSVPEVIAHLEQGKCSVCQCKREIRETEGWVETLNWGIPLPCPLCIGVDWMLDDEDFLKRYFDDDLAEDEGTLTDAWEARCDRINQ